MRSIMTGLVAAGVLALGGCAELTPDERLAVGALGGAATGLIAADQLEADDDWRIIAALGGAAAGTVVARNTATNQCAYSRGDGTYYRAPCRR
ncbi:glycine zipper 2TM domain-containing protein [Roseitranquillus sediminis]|uniref:glycine zipper 2TM domain-containing protein n=1 Tax=Roseitranquillus sediminis TaxID=2809051 RepID=UPI001D0CB11E|nr:glycine zipper 2TM domain-containing protein [Roseitranquillus sediminis]MBM9594692.1 glycine zipper 2TM domain-containing protein [Roseitranquillus sediminis]